MMVKNAVLTLGVISWMVAVATPSVSLAATEKPCVCPVAAEVAINVDSTAQLPMVQTVKVDQDAALKQFKDDLLGQFKSLSGSVFLTTANGQQPATVGSLIRVSTVITTGATGQAELSFYPTARQKAPADGDSADQCDLSIGPSTTVSITKTKDGDFCATITNGAVVGEVAPFSVNLGALAGAVVLAGGVVVALGTQGGQGPVSLQ